MTQYRLQVKHQGNWSDIIGLHHIKYTEAEAKQAVEQLLLQKEYYDMPYTDYRYVQITDTNTDPEPFKMQEITYGVKKLDKSKLSEEDKKQLKELKEEGT